MSWFKVSDGLAFHRKALAAGNEALGAWVRAGAWSSAPDNMTDGYIPPEVASAIAPPRVWAKLRAAGLVDAPKGRDGQQIHDFLAYNPSAEDLRRDREMTRQRVDAWRSKRRGNAGCNAVTNADTNAVGTGAPTRPDPTRPAHDQIPPTPQGVAPPPADAGEPEGPTKGKAKRETAQDRYRRAFVAGIHDGAPEETYSLGGSLGLPFVSAIGEHSRGLRGEELESWIRTTVAEWRRSADPTFAGGWSPSAFVKWLNGGRRGRGVVGLQPAAKPGEFSWMTDGYREIKA